MGHDVFISYAHVDDAPLPPADKGWVTTFVQTLKVRLAQKLGRAEACTVWMDGLLAGNEPLTEQLMARVRDSATMVVIYSPGYRASQWCNREKDEFLRLTRTLGTRLFVVERDREDRVPELADLRGYSFWVADDATGETRTLGDPVITADDRLYYAKLGDLVTDLARELQEQRKEESTPTQRSDAPQVFLAEVTDDLDPVRDEIRRYLEQKQIRVVPHQTYVNRGDTESFRRDVDDLLRPCALFVQLLGPIAGKKAPDSDLTYVQLQAERARENGKPMVQWRDRNLDVAALGDSPHAALLQAADVLATGTEELKTEIVARLAPPPPPKPVAADLVFVNAQHDDRTFAEQLSSAIAGYGAGCVLPLEGADPAAVRADLEQNLLDCDKLIFVYGATTPTWVREQLRYARKVLFRRDRELQGLAVYNAPPPTKPPVGFQLPNQLTIEGGEGVNESGLRAFLTGGRG